MGTQLSVVIACRDAASTLGEQLAALAQQRVADLRWEVLVCDNRSTDGTAAVVEHFRAALPVRLVDASGCLGPAHARNVGAAVSDADWLAFVDADDVVSEGWLAAVVAGLSRHPFVAGRFEPARLNDARTAATRAVPQQRGLQGTPGTGLPHAGAGNLAIHRAVFDSVGGFDESLTCLEDTDFCWRVQLAGHPLVFWPDAVLHVRLRSTWWGRTAQAYRYGAAYAELERRHAGLPAQEPPAGSSPAVGDDDVRRRGPLSLWGLAWLMGHRLGRATPPLSAAPGAPAPAAERRQR